MALRAFFAFRQHGQVTRFKTTQATVDFLAETPAVRVDARLSGPPGKHVLRLEVFDCHGLQFQSQRTIHFQRGRARLTITPVLESEPCPQSRLVLTIDGEELSAISLASGKENGRHNHEIR